MKTRYIILIISVIIILAFFSGILSRVVVLPFLEPHTVLCTLIMIPAALLNPEFDLVLFFDSCGR